MTPLLEAGIILFNSSRYFEAHESWEDLWREEKGPLRTFYQGLIQAAVGLHHLYKGNAVGARAQLTKSLAKLELYPARTAQVDVEQLRQDLRKVLDQMEVGGQLKSPLIVVQSDGTF